jgi:hypothetical protein
MGRTYRLTTLSQFAQCIYLLFSAVYVCKESIEHVLLLHDPVDDSSNASASHGAAHGSMGHGQSAGSPMQDLGVVAGDWVELGCVAVRLPFRVENDGESTVSPCQLAYYCSRLCFVSPLLSFYGITQV